MMIIRIRMTIIRMMIIRIVIRIIMRMRPQASSWSTTPPRWSRSSRSQQCKPLTIKIGHFGHFREPNFVVFCRMLMMPACQMGRRRSSWGSWRRSWAGWCTSPSRPCRSWAPPSIMNPDHRSYDHWNDHCDQRRTWRRRRRWGISDSGSPWPGRSAGPASRSDHDNDHDEDGDEDEEDNDDTDGDDERKDLISQRPLANHVFSILVFAALLKHIIVIISS